MSSEPEAPQPFVRLAVIVEGGIGLVAVALGWLLGHPPMMSIHWNPPAAAWGVLATVPLIVLLWVCVRLPFQPFQELLRFVEEQLVPWLRNCRLAEMALVAALAGLGEEMLFRGVIQAALADWLGGPAGPWIACVLVAVLFGLAHWLTTTYAILATLIGLYLGGLWLATENLIVPIAAHALYDFVALVYLTRIRSRSGKPTEQVDQRSCSGPSQGLT